METKKFKKFFSRLAERNGFKVMRDGWLKESPECIVTLDLQKCPYTRFYYLNIKIFTQGKFGNYYYSDDEELIMKGIGYLLSRGSSEYKAAFDLPTQMPDAEREQKLEDCFRNFLVQFVEKALTRKGMIELADTGQLFMTDETRRKLIQFEAAKQNENATQA